MLEASLRVYYRLFGDAWLDSTDSSVSGFCAIRPQTCIIQLMCKLQLSLLSSEVFSGEFQMPRRSIHEGQVSCDVSADEQDYTHIL